MDDYSAGVYDPPESRCGQFLGYLKGSLCQGVKGGFDLFARLCALAYLFQEGSNGPGDESSRQPSLLHRFGEDRVREHLFYRWYFPQHLVQGHLLTPRL